ncbi:MAG: ATP-grasp domain-containing protein [Planctomycetota bacterium]
MRGNVLITSAGRRGVLVQVFQREAAGSLPGAQVFAGDLRPGMSAACKLADRAFALPRVSSLDYVPVLLELCEEHDVALVVPTIDTELQSLAESRRRFQDRGVSVAVSDLALVEACRDKRRAEDLFGGIGIKSPRLVENPAESDYPLFARPVGGSCSQGVRLLRSRDELLALGPEEPQMVLNEYVDPAVYEEFTIDLYYDVEGTLKCLVPRLRLETRAGEVSKGRTTRLPEYCQLWDCFAGLRGARGCLTAQVFRHATTGELLGIEINPRFGGGYPLSYEAGANYPGWLLREYCRDEPLEDFHDWEAGLTMLRYDGQVFVRDSAA